MSITNGDRVEIVGLVARTDLNGSLGTVERLARDGEDRWRVKLDGKEKKLALKPENLRTVIDAAANDDASRPEIVGSRGGGVTEGLLAYRDRV
jgi:hypothetical protein